MTETGPAVVRARREDWGGSAEPCSPADLVLVKALSQWQRTPPRVPHQPRPSDVALDASILAGLRAWTTRYARRRFSTQWRVWTPRDALDVIEDASQHLAIALTRTQAQAVPAMSVCHALAWCKRVVANFIISELRWRARTSGVRRASASGGTASAEMAGSEGVEWREAFRLLVNRLREAIACRAAPGRVGARLRLFDEFVESWLVERGGARAPLDRSRADQRRCRGRRLARDAWLAVKQSSAVSLEMVEVASALGLE